MSPLINLIRFSMDKTTSQKQTVKEISEMPHDGNASRERATNGRILLNLALVLIICILLAVLTLLIVFNARSDPAITNFAECVNAGYHELANPARCNANGTIFFKTPVSLMPSATLTPTLTPTVAASPTVTETSKTVTVYFSKDPSSFDDPAIAVAVSRQTTRSDVAAFAVEQLLAGPTESEQIGGLFTPLKLSGSSNCSGKDFSIHITSGKATIKFCKDIISAGILEDSRIKTVIEKTLNEFSTVSSVIILTKDEHCFGDMSGLDLCKS